MKFAQNGPLGFQALIFASVLLVAVTALAEKPQSKPMSLTIQPDMVRVAGGDRNIIPETPALSPDKDWQNLFYEDFEGAFPGDNWTILSTNLVPFWGVWDCWYGASASHSAACAAAGPGAITCGSLYPEYMSTWMIAGPFDLSGGNIADAELSAILNLASQPETDYIFFGVSLDELQYYGNQYSYLAFDQQITMDLREVEIIGSVIGQAEVWIGFYFRSDDSISFGEGAEIDDVVLRVDMPPPNIAPQITLTTPNGGENWFAGSTKTINYTASDTDAGPGSLLVSLDYSANGGGSWQNIASSLANTGSYEWVVPEFESANCLVRASVSDSEDSDSDTSDASFSVVIPGTNVLSVGDGSGASGTTLVIPITLANEDPVKGIQADLVFNASYAVVTGITTLGRGAGLTAETSMLSPGRARILLFFDDTSELAAGNGDIAHLNINLIGGGGTTTITPELVQLAGPDAESWPNSVESGNLVVTPPTQAPTVKVVALKNPGRQRSLTFLVSVVNGNGTPPVVTAAGVSVAMTDTGLGTVFKGQIHVVQNAYQVIVDASATNTIGTGTDQVVVNYGLGVSK